MLVKAFLGMMMMGLLVQGGIAADRGDIQKYFSETASKVKATADPVQKREILNGSLEKMSLALERAESSGLISTDDRAGMNSLRMNVREHQDELMGRNGYERVADGQINAFSDYVVQAMEQADQTITISLVAALLIIIILVLIL